MNREEILTVVCGCIADIGLEPSDWEETCEGTTIGSLGLGDEDIKSIILCIYEKVEQSGCSVNLGVADFDGERTVGQVVSDIELLLSCDE